MIMWNKFWTSSVAGGVTVLLWDAQRGTDPVRNDVIMRMPSVEVVDVRSEALMLAGS